MRQFARWTAVKLRYDYTINNTSAEVFCNFLYYFTCKYNENNCRMFFSLMPLKDAKEIHDSTIKQSSLRSCVQEKYAQNAEC